MNMRNFLHSALMLSMMTAVLGAVGYILGGRDGLIITVAFVFMFLSLGRGASSRWMLTAIGAAKVRPDQAPVIHAIVQELSLRAGLGRAPDVYLMDAEGMLGFSTGKSQDDAAIVLSGPLVQGMNAREIAGVLSHEISHIAAGDLAVMGMADTITRMTRTLSVLGLVLVLFNIPLAVSGGGYMPWAALGLLMLAPLLSFLLQMALSRGREFEADHGAVDISGDPEALARALEKLEIQQNGLFRHVFLPHQPGSEPSLLRSHPITQERVERIMHMRPAMGPLPAELISERHGYPIDGADGFGVPIRWLLRWWR